MGEVRTQVGRCVRAGTVVLFGCSDYAFTLEVPESLPGEPPTPLAADFNLPGEEPTSPFSCSDWQGWEPYEVAIDESCQGEAGVGEILSAGIEWQWTESEAFPGFDGVMAAPAIGNLTDDNGDGVIDDFDIPDIVFTAFQDRDYNLEGTLTVLSGDTGEVIWSMLAPTEDGYVQFASTGGVAIGDLEGDGLPDICVAGHRVAVICMEASGQFKWAAGEEFSQSGAPSMADMDGDGLAEVILGRQIFTHDGQLQGIGTEGRGSVDVNSVTSFAVDWNGDGFLEVIAGNAIYDRFGATLVEFGVEDGYPAVADMDLDGRPDLVVVSEGNVQVFDNDAEYLWGALIVGEGDGGPPTIADYDGDGWPEVGVAGEGSYTVFDDDSTVLWVNRSTDVSSGHTGSAVFDFEGDGISEVIYADEYVMGVYDGRDGSMRMQFEDHASGTLVEYPIVVDVDNDGVTEIVVVSNDYAREGWSGITVLGNINRAWAPARPIWNQHAFFTTNVDDDGATPYGLLTGKRAMISVRGYGDVALPWMPDLHPGEPMSCLDDCALGMVKLSIPIENGGMLGAGGFDVRLMRHDGQVVRELGNFRTLQQGQSHVLNVNVSRDEWGDEELFLRLDGVNMVSECNEENNRYSLGFWPCLAD